MEIENLMKNIKKEIDENNEKRGFITEISTHIKEAEKNIVNINILMIFYDYKRKKQKKKLQY